MKFVWLIILLFGYQVGFNQKINGVNVVSPQTELAAKSLSNLSRINTNWVSFCPFAFMKSGETYVEYNSINNYWGDKTPNLKKLVQNAHQQGLRVLIKPHVWVEGEGWPGDFTPGVGKWKEWGGNYTQFILELANLCQEENVEMLSIGTEFKNSVKTVPGYWKRLIESVREVYSGKLIYAANWDNYQYIPFWKQLDYIGIDGYFPLVDATTPAVTEISQAWMPIARSLKRFSEKQNKAIVFTEYGYRSIDNTANKQWLIESIPDDQNINLEAQNNAYLGFYNSVWENDWCAGGFIWKWHLKEYENKLNFSSGYTPQGKPVEKIILEWYSKEY